MTVSTHVPDQEPSAQELAAFGERARPELTDVNRPFWTGGADGRLHLQFCEACSRFIHPPQPRCPRCLAERTSSRAVSGRGSVFSYTVNHYPWLPGWTPPYVIATVELVEQPALRVTSNVVAADPRSVHIGMAVSVCFQRQSDVYFPLFRATGEDVDR